MSATDNLAFFFVLFDSYVYFADVWVICMKMCFLCDIIKSERMGGGVLFQAECGFHQTCHIRPHAGLYTPMSGHMGCTWSVWYVIGGSGGAVKVAILEAKGLVCLSPHRRRMSTCLMNERRYKSYCSLYAPQGVKMAQERYE